MLYAIIETGDKQFRVENGLVLDIPQLDAEDNSPLTFDRVLLCSNGDQTCVGAPLVEGAQVKATCLGESKGDKLFVFKIKRRKKYRKKTGHRQKFTSVRIDEIIAPIVDNDPPVVVPVEPEVADEAVAEQADA